jgi:hypothetical protein
MAGQTEAFLFKRPKVAEAMVDALLGVGPFNHASGLFLAAPRRTGKSTFMREDLMPALADRGVSTIYVDLWEDRQKDPAILISDAVKAAVRSLDSGLTRTIRQSGLAKLTIAGALTFDVEKLGQADGATLTEAFKAITGRTGRPTALIVDEAQQALATSAGLDAMFALKAARDALNQGRPATSITGPALLLVFTGSHRDKLANLVLKRDQPFFGADVADFPRLGRDYTDAYTAWINARLDPCNRFEPDDVWEAFKVLGHRPEILQKALKDTALGPAMAPGLKTDLATGARALRERIWEDYESEFGSLTGLQRIVLGHLIKEGLRFAPFSAASITAYSAAAGRKVTAAEAQSALDALRQKNIVWRNARAAYSLEDQDMAEWFIDRRPPAGTDGTGGDE